MTDINRDEWYGKLAPEVKEFLKKAALAKAQPMSKDTYRGVRRFTDTLSEKMKTVPVPVERIDDRSIPGLPADLPVRVYTPPGGGLFPVLLFFHGGGWVVGNLEMEDHVCRALCRDTPALVISVDYRLAPEHPFPAAPEDCYRALSWAAKEAAGFGGDPARIAVSGESAGANLAAVVSIMSRDRHGPAIAFQVLFNPVTTIEDVDSDSARAFGEGFLLTREDMEGTRSLYTPEEDERRNPYASPLLAPVLSGLPPALIITAGCDPLRDDGERYAERLREAGVPVKYTCCEDMVHGFLYFFRGSESSLKALADAASSLRDALGM